MMVTVDPRVLYVPPEWVIAVYISHDNQTIHEEFHGKYFHAKLHFADKFVYKLVFETN